LRFWYATSADVVLYDAFGKRKLLGFINPNLFSLVNAKFDTNINKHKLMEYNLLLGPSHGHVVRLKGGDHLFF
jgi:siroheme synthase